MVIHQLTKMYEDYLEEFVFKTAKIIAQKLFGKKSGSKDQEENKDQRSLTDAAVSGAENVEDDLETSEQKESSPESDVSETKPENGVDGKVEKIESSADDAPSTTEASCSSRVKKRKNAKKSKSSLDAQIENTPTDNNALVKCNTFDALCNEMSEEIAEAEKIAEEEENRVITEEGTF